HWLLLLARLPTRVVVGDRLFDGARGEKQPAVIVSLLLVARAESGFREYVGEVGADCRALCDDMAFVLERRDLAQGMDRQIALALHLVVRDDLRFIGLSDLLEHPARDASARLRVGIEDEVGHSR